MSMQTINKIWDCLKRADVAFVTYPDIPGAFYVNRGSTTGVIFVEDYEDIDVVRMQVLVVDRAQKSDDLMSFIAHFKTEVGGMSYVPIDQECGQVILNHSQLAGSMDFEEFAAPLRILMATGDELDDFIQTFAGGYRSIDLEDGSTS